MHSQARSSPSPAVSLGSLDTVSCRMIYGTPGIHTVLLGSISASTLPFERRSPKQKLETDFSLQWTMLVGILELMLTQVAPRHLLNAPLSRS